MTGWRRPGCESMGVPATETGLSLRKLQASACLGRMGKDRTYKLRPVQTSRATATSWLSLCRWALSRQMAFGSPTTRFLRQPLCQGYFCASRRRMLLTICCALVFHRLSAASHPCSCLMCLQSTIASLFTATWQGPCRYYAVNAETSLSV